VVKAASSSSTAAVSTETDEEAHLVGAELEDTLSSAAAKLASWGSSFDKKAKSAVRDAKAWAGSVDATKIGAGFDPGTLKLDERVQALGEKFDRARSDLSSAALEMTTSASSKLKDSATKAKTSAAASAAAAHKASTAAGKVVGKAGTGAGKALQTAGSAAKDKMAGMKESAQEAVEARKRLGYYLGLYAAGTALLSLSFSFLPIIAIAPQKFAGLFTVGSVLMMGAPIVLRGPKKFLQKNLAKKRLPFFAGYIVSLIGTLWAVFIRGSYFFTVAFAAFQVVFLAYYLVSNVPGGTRALTWIGKAFCRMATRACRK